MVPPKSNYFGNASPLPVGELPTEGDVIRCGKHHVLAKELVWSKKHITSDIGNDIVIIIVSYY